MITEKIRTLKSRNQVKRFSLFLAVSVLFSSGAFAAQNNCMRKYAGQWSAVNSTGIATIHAFGEDGSAVCSGNPFCVRSESWSCNGNQLVYNNGMASMTFTMAPNGRSGVGIGGFPPNQHTITRIGPGNEGGTDNSAESSTSISKPASTATSALCSRLNSSYREYQYEQRGGGNPQKIHACKMLDDLISNYKEAGCDRENRGAKRALAGWEAEQGPKGLCSPSRIKSIERCMATGKTLDGNDCIGGTGGGVRG